MRNPLNDMDLMMPEALKLKQGKPAEDSSSSTNDNKTNPGKDETLRFVVSGKKLEKIETRTS